MKQEYKKYTKEDHEVWSLLFDKQMNNLQDKACAEFLDCSESLKEVLNGSFIPDYDDLDKMILDATGWSIEVVEGLIPVADFYELLAKKKFCAPAWIRKKHQIDYLEEPDMFHDIIGHIPLFMNQEYADYVQRLGEIGFSLKGNTEAEKQLERIYWYTNEFGVLEQQGQIKIYGAGIISSFGETLNVWKNNSLVNPIHFDKVITLDFRTDIIQDKYFSIESFDVLHQLLDQFESYLKINKKPSLFTQ